MEKNSAKSPSISIPGSSKYVKNFCQNWLVAFVGVKNSAPIFYRIKRKIQVTHGASGFSDPTKDSKDSMTGIFT